MFYIFDSKCFILNNGKGAIGNFDAKSNEGIFLDYSSKSKVYRVFNKRTLIVEELIHVTTHDSNYYSPKTCEEVNDDLNQILKNYLWKTRKKYPLVTISLMKKI